MISIAALIYRSAAYADALAGSLYRHTPLLRDGRAEFYFVANDATGALLEHLDREGYRYFKQDNPRRTDAELFAMGYAKPEYIHRVYRGWNRAIAEASDRVVLINSDNLLSPGWLEHLLKYDDGETVVASHLIERPHPKHGVFPGAEPGEHGDHPRNFDETGFLEHAAAIAREGTRDGGAFMPALFRRSWFERAGLYPEGNLAAGSFDRVLRYGDEDLFVRLKAHGIRHVTALDSIVYHFKEGEMDE